MSRFFSYFLSSFGSIGRFANGTIERCGNPNIDLFKIHRKVALRIPIHQIQECPKYKDREQVIITGVVHYSPSEPILHFV